MPLTDEQLNSKEYARGTDDKGTGATRVRSFRKSPEEIYDMVFEMIDLARVVGFDLAAGNLQHYVAGTGQDLEIPIAPFMEEKFFEAHIKEVLLPMAKEHIGRLVRKGIIEDGIKYITNPIGATTRPKQRGDIYYAVGGFTVQARIHLTARKHEDNPSQLIVCYTRLELRVVDRYDWHVGFDTWVPPWGRVRDADIRMLEKTHKAKPYNIYSPWTGADLLLDKLQETYLLGP